MPQKHRGLPLFSGSKLHLLVELYLYFVKFFDHYYNSVQVFLKLLQNSRITDKVKNPVPGAGFLTPLLLRLQSTPAEITGSTQLPS